MFRRHCLSFGLLVAIVAGLAYAQDGNEKLIRGILAELPKGSPLDTGRAEPLPRIDNLVGYEPAPADTKLRKRIKEAIAFLDKQREVFDAEVMGSVDEMKLQAGRAQNRLAVTLLDLDDTITALRSAQDQLQQEKSKRWQALHHFVLAALLERRVYCIEYNHAMGLVRSDDVEASAKGWRLQYRDKLASRGAEGRSAKANLEQAVALFERIVKEHKGSPYAILADRHLRRPAGLIWKAKE